MKTVSASLTNHLNQEVTALCTCWEITRRDGQVFRFTDSDESVTVGGLVYEAVGAYQRTAIESTATLSVDNLDVEGISSTLSLSEADLRAGLFDNAEVKVFLTSWDDSVDGEVKLRRGFFGETTLLSNDTFKVELRGLMQRLSHTYTDIYATTCRHDLGDNLSPGCSVVIMPPISDTGAEISTGDPFRTPGNSVPLGTSRKVVVGDYDFSLAGAVGNFSNSRYWEDTGIASATVITDVTAPNGEYVVEGDASGSQIVQTIDILSLEGVTASAVDADQTHLNFFAWGQNNTNVKIEYLGRDMQLVGRGGVWQPNNDNTFTDLADRWNFDRDAMLTMWCYFPTTPSHGADGGLITSGEGIGNYFIELQNGGEILFRKEDPSGFSVDTNTAVPVGRWFHLAIVQKGSYQGVYFDGVEVWSTSSMNLNWDFDVVILFEDMDTRDAQFKDIVFFEGLPSQTNERTALIRRFFKRAWIDPDIDSNVWRQWTGDLDGKPYNIPNTLSNSLVNGSNVRNNLAPTAMHVGVPGVDDVSWDSGVFGASWALNQTRNAPIPPGTRHVRITVDLPDDTSRLDSVFGWINDESEKAYPPESFDNVYAIKGGITNNNAWLRAGIVTQGGDARTFSAEIDEPRAVDGWFTTGVVTFTSGDNAGVAMEVKSWTQADSLVELFLSLPNPVRPGDEFSIYPGCDKTRPCCSFFFDNISDFGGTPDVPGEDNILRYPDAK